MIRALSIAVLLCWTSPKPIQAQPVAADAIVNYIKTYAELAIDEMQRTGFPASIKIAQGIIETSAGRGELVGRSNNHFGLKCKSNWTGGKVYHDDDEQGECFRQYEDAATSFKDHSDYVKSQPRYAALFTYDPDDHIAWAWGLKNAGYATNPIYAQTLIKYVEAYGLNELNRIARKKDADGLEPYLTRISDGSPSLSSVQPYPEPERKSLVSSEGKRSKKQGNKKAKHAVAKHTVKKGESLYSIAKKYNTNVDAIKKVNRMKGSDLKVGQTIKLPKNAS